MAFGKLKQIIGLAVFLISAVVLVMTVQPSVSFWDPGEISAASYSLMVPHPPGGPLWLIFGRLFSMLPIAQNIGLRINLLSVTASCFSVLLLYLIAIKLIENYRKKEDQDTTGNVITYISAAIGALAFAFCDTFWFNAVESNYFAVSTLLYSLVVWLMMVWNERFDKPGNEKYIILMAYVIGLSAGVHLMSVLAILTFIWIVVMRKYVNDDETYKKTGYIFLIHIGILAIVAIGLWASQTSATAPSPEEYKDFDSKFKWIMVGLSVAFMAIFRKKIFARSSFYIPLLIGGLILPIAYPGIVKIFPQLLLYVGGPTPGTNLIIFFILLAGLLYLSYWAKQKNKPILNLSALCLLFALIGFTSYAMIIIRANQQTPMNENEPKDFTKLVYYLGREQYGDFPVFKRRFSPDPAQQGVYTEYSSDLDFLWRYQINHMFNRYILWNFVGRDSTVQDAGVNFKDYFAIPLLIGLLGLYFHFRKDWKMASAFLVLFVFMGYLIAFYQNQQEPQPRERDYFYDGALFVFCIWIATGLRELIEVIREKIKSPSAGKGMAFACLALGLLLIPGRMLSVNYHSHDRSKDWMPWDLSYNLLQSCAPNAILFTNGDNDTFPLWYLQYVEGIRRDIRVVCLSLANTDWYVRQLKNTEPYGVAKVKFDLSDDQINELQPERWDPQNISIPVGKDIIQKFGVTDTSILKTGKLTFRMPNTMQYGDVKAIRAQDIVVREIVVNNTWDRPVYFASTCPYDARIGLDDYLQMEGLAYRLVPERKPRSSEYVNEPIVRKQLFDENPSYSKTYQPGFKFRGLNDPSVFFDKDTHERMAQGYRGAFMSLAIYYLNEANNKDMCIKTLDMMEKKIPRSHIEADYRQLYNIGNIYYSAGAYDKFAQIAKEVEPIALKNLSTDATSLKSPYNSYRILEDIYINLKEYNKAVNLLSKLQAAYPDDPGIKAEIDKLNEMSNTNQKSNEIKK
ncbi:MAG: DUF2723 domain-containing protein [Bacteroidota bacterium]|nr:DUF2723 domain-containing protein [Bacteroidota bacterium]